MLDFHILLAVISKNYCLPIKEKNPTLCMNSSCISTTLKFTDMKV